MFPKIGVPQNGWFMMEYPIKMDDLGVPLFSKTSIFILYSTKKGCETAHPLDRPLNLIRPRRWTCHGLSSHWSCQRFGVEMKPSQAIWCHFCHLERWWVSEEDTKKIKEIYYILCILQKNDFWWFWLFFKRRCICNILLVEKYHDSPNSVPQICTKNSWSRDLLL